MVFTAAPATVIVPLVGRSSPASRFRNVDFPLPEGPMRAVKLPAAISRVRFSNTSMTWLSR